MFETLAVLLATAVAAWLRPWRMLGGAAPPWPWFLLWLVLPLMWSADRWSGQAAMPLVSGAVLALLLAGWPLTMLALAAAALLAAADGTLPVGEALSRCFWLGTLPASLSLALGALARRWWSGQVFGYVLGRAFGGTLAALWISAALAAVVALARTDAAAGITLAAAASAAPVAGQPMAWLLAGFAEACLTGLAVTWAVAMRPAWVATWADRLYGVRRG